MKKKTSVSIVAALLVALFLASGVLAASIGNIDGVWEYAEDNTDQSSNAYCVTYGTGPGTNETARSRNNPAVQTGPVTDENQIHYGKGASMSGSCPSTTGALTDAWFDAQSGIGFDGANNPGALSLDTNFLIGRITHYNRPIYVSDDGLGTEPWRNLLWIDLDVNINNIKCAAPGGTFVDPVEGPNQTFIYRINFNETPNTCSWINRCTYQNFGACPPDGCPDRVWVASAPAAQSYHCGTNAVPEEQGAYTIQLSGFVGNTNDVCPATPSGGFGTEFITRENTTNHACLYGRITGFVPSAVELKNFSAALVENGVAIHWDTTNEVNTLGFNLYRSDTLYGQKVKINDELILNPGVPGGMTGASYDYLDEITLTEAYYWLEEIETNGNAISYAWVLTQ